MTAPAAQTRALADAIRSALDLPYPADPADDERRSRLLRDRVISVVIVLDNIIDGHKPSVTGAIEVLDAAMARNPITYKPRPKNERGAA